MLGRIILLFIAVPFIELALLIIVSKYVGLSYTLGLVIVTGILGASLAREQGLKAWDAAKRELRAGRMPSEAVFDGLMILVAGAFLLTPGILTDMTGFLLLTPPLRRRLQYYVMNRVSLSLSLQTPSAHWNTTGSKPGDAAGRSAGTDDDVIDVEFREHQD